MKDSFLVKEIWKNLSFFVNILVAFGTAWFTVDSYLSSKAEAVEQKIMEIRKVDMQHISERLQSIDNKLNALIVRGK